MLIVAALQLVWGWTKSFPVSIGRPGLRVVVQAIEIAVFVPLRAGVRLPLGRDRRGRRDARLDRRVLCRVDGPARAASSGWRTPEAVAG